MSLAYLHLDGLYAGGLSYYDHTACHLDLVALATRDKWTALATPTRRRLTVQGRDVPAQLIRDSNVDALLLNGRSVVTAFAALTDIDLHTEHIDDWALPRPAGHPVAGYQFSGTLHAVGGIDLGRQITVHG